MSELSENSRRVLAFIQDYQRQHGRAPSQRDIRDGCGFAAGSSVEWHLKKLIDAGLIRVDKGHRAIVLLYPDYVEIETPQGAYIRLPSGTDIDAQRRLVLATTVDALWK